VPATPQQIEKRLRASIDAFCEISGKDGLSI
jgi:hypothetical protein